MDNTETERQEEIIFIVRPNTFPEYKDENFGEIPQKYKLSKIDGELSVWGLVGNVWYKNKDVGLLCKYLWYERSDITEEDISDAYNEGFQDGYSAAEREIPIKEEYAPKGQTAVTLYIPDGMKLGESLSAVQSYSYKKHGQPIWEMDLEQIQEAIDKAFNQEKDEE